MVQSIHDLLSKFTGEIHQMSTLSNKELDTEKEPYTSVLSGMIDSMHSEMCSEFDEAMTNNIKNLNKNYSMCNVTYVQAKKLFKHAKSKEYVGFSMKEVEVSDVKKCIEDDLCKNTWINRPKDKDVYTLISDANKKIVTRFGTQLPETFDDDYTDLSRIAKEFIPALYSQSASKRITKVESVLDAYMISNKKLIDYITSQKESIYASMMSFKKNTESLIISNKKNSVTQNCGITIDNLEFMIFMYSYAKNLFGFYTEITNANLIGMNDYLKKMNQDLTTNN